MKKIKWSFIAIALIAILCAFATVGRRDDPQAGKTGLNTFVKIDPMAEDEEWVCNSSPSDTCLFYLKSTVNPSDPPGTVYTRADIDVHVPGTTNKVFVDLTQ